MKMRRVVKLIPLIMLVSVLTACGMMPAVDDVFVDQKEDYKRAHELPSLEIPPGLSGGVIKDEYDGGTKSTLPASTASAVVETTPLNDNQPKAELMGSGVDSHLLVRDSLRNAWRKTIGVLEEQGYDIDDKNRQTGQIYLNIAEGDSSNSMLSSLSFWKKVDTDVYVLVLKSVENGVQVSVLDEEKNRVDNNVSTEILADLLTQLAQ